MFDDLFKKLGFTPTVTWRNGPRFLVVGGELAVGDEDTRRVSGHPSGVGYQKAVFKAYVEDLYRKRRRPRALTGLQKEAILFEYLNISQIPKFYGSGVEEGHFWMLMEWVGGEPQNAGESTFLVKDSFFKAENAALTVRFLEDLHKASVKVHSKIKSVIHRYNLSDYERLMAWEKRHFFEGGFLEEMESFINSSRGVFDKNNHEVITHHEFYGPHIFLPSVGKSLAGFKVIDWENVGWGNRAHDLVTLWLRAYRHEEFRKDLLNRYYKMLKVRREDFEILFRMEVILQSLGNLNHFENTVLKGEQVVKNDVQTFFRHSIVKALESFDSLYL